MKKLIFLPPSLLLLVLTTFLSCKKEAVTPNVDSAHPNPKIVMTQGADGILNVEITAQPSSTSAASDRDGCTMYEALRFTEYTGLTPGPDDDRVYVQIQYRLVKVNKTTHAVTPFTDYFYAGYSSVQGVGGLNISWFEFPPLEDYWYAIDIYNCTRKVPVLGTGTFVINDFWDDDYLVQLDPWTYHVDYEPLFGPIVNGNPSGIGATVTLKSDCTISAD